MKLTEREEAAMRLFVPGGSVCGGDVAELWPLVRRSGTVVSALIRKGLVTCGEYWDEVAGSELLLTPLGRDVVAAMTEEDS